MGKSLYIAEKPSVALEFARVLGISGKRQDGYVESEDAVVTWCVGHLVTMSYPEAYDPSLKRWDMKTLPFFPTDWKYQVIDSCARQFKIVAGLLNRKDVDTIYVCTDSGREGEYIYRLVRQEAHVRGKNEKRVWIDSQTEEEIKRGIREARDLSYYDALAASAYLRAKEDYLMGINFSRALTLKFGRVVSGALKKDRAVLSVGRVMTCVLGMVVRREREIRAFVPSKFYRVTASFLPPAAGSGNQAALSSEIAGSQGTSGNPITSGTKTSPEHPETESGNFLEAEWRAVEGTRYYQSPKLYKENGFKERKDAEKLIGDLEQDPPLTFQIVSAERKSEKKNPPLLFNLAEIQNECSRRFKKSPDETLNIIQSLYEKKLVTYPRTDARVLSTAVAKEIRKNISGLTRVDTVADFANEILAKEAFKGIEKTVYTDDKKITDHYALIPTGQGLGALKGLNPVERNVYDLICRRFLCIFYPAARYEKTALVLERKKEKFFANLRVLKDPGYLKVWENGKKEKDQEDALQDTGLVHWISGLKKGESLTASSLSVREGETSAPKRYSSGTLILAMENAGQLIEDEELRAQIRSSGIGTSATRAEILKKLNTIDYLKTNAKTQIVTPSLQGELVYDVVDVSMKQLLNAELTASWEKGLNMVSQGEIASEEYMDKLTAFVSRRVDVVKGIERPEGILPRFSQVFPFYRS